MTKTKYIIGAFTALVLGATIAMKAAPGGRDIVILHTNDTHSTVDPDAAGAGGALQRKAVIDSVRKAEKNVILVDAGDMVQGSLYFKFFGGDVEYPLMNMMGYDIRILGNHEFDNGLQTLASHYRDVKGDRLSANYDMSATPLAGMFRPYSIKKVGGKKIGFIGINVDPQGLITTQNSEGIVFHDIVDTANETARHLRHDLGCDMVVVVSHIGVSDKDGAVNDYGLARASHDIDVIIGGHSHTLIRPDVPTPPSRVKNADGREVLVVQTGKYGRYIGKLAIDPTLTDRGAEAVTYSLIPVTDRFETSKLDRRMSDFLAPYRHKVDSVNARVIAQAAFDMSSDDRNGPYANWAADFARWYGALKLDSIAPGRHMDIGLMNVGGIRQNMPAGDVTEGQMLSTFPFANRMVVMEIKGSDFIEAMQAAAAKGGEGVSENIRVVTDGQGHVVRVVIDGREMDPDKIYTLSTIDYVAQGNDRLSSIAHGHVLWTDEVDMSAPVLRYIRTINDLGLPIAPDRNGRFVKSVMK